jgi:hypothetical protein
MAKSVQAQIEKIVPRAVIRLPASRRLLDQIDRALKSHRVSGRAVNEVRRAHLSRRDRMRHTRDEQGQFMKALVIICPRRKANIFVLWNKSGSERTEYVFWDEVPLPSFPFG